MFSNITKHFILPQEQSSSTKILIYIAVAYLFGMAMRFILWYQVAGVEAFWLDGKPLPIYSPDAGLYGFYAKQILSGVSYPFVSEYMPGYLIASIVSLGFDIDWVMFLLPAFLAPLVAIPTILMSVALNNAKMGFYAALIAVIGVNFYTRSYVGYMDTDVLNLFWPYMAVAAGMFAVLRKSIIWSVLFVLSLVGFYFWYHSSLVIIAAIIGMLFVVIPVVYRNKIIAIIASLLVLGSLFVVDLEKVGKRASDYYNADSVVKVEGKEQTYHFTNTLESVAEAQDVNVLSGHLIYAGMAPYTVLATLGFIILALMHPAVLMALPLIGLGYAASIMGMRFMMFATPAYALGFMALFTLLSQWFQTKSSNQKWRWFGLVGLFIGISIMSVNLLRTNPSFTPSFFKHNDVKALESFSAQSSAKDLLISWWDYGWPLWYYTNHRNTLVDNGRHGPDTYLASNLLLAKDDAFVANAMHYFAAKQKARYPILQNLAKEEDITARFENLKSHAPMLELNRDIFILLHRDMLLTYKTIEDFANINLQNGQKTTESAQIYISNLLQPYSKKVPVVKGDTFNFDLRNGMIVGHDGAQTQVQGVIISENGKVVAAKRYNPRSPMNLIIYNKTKAIYLDNKALNTFLVKALLFDQFNKNRFEKVAETEAFKILKLKH
jgi:undecaprenyl-diphosphooligosaccharide--protein glycosyltransferase